MLQCPVIHKNRATVQYKGPSIYKCRPIWLWNFARNYAWTCKIFFHDASTTVQVLSTCLTTVVTSLYSDRPASTFVYNTMGVTQRARRAGPSAAAETYTKLVMMAVGTGTAVQ